MVHLRNDVDALRDKYMREIPCMKFIAVWLENDELNWGALLQDGTTCSGAGAMWNPRTGTLRAEESIEPDHARIAREYLLANGQNIDAEVAEAFHLWTTMRSGVTAAVSDPSA